MAVDKTTLSRLADTQWLLFEITSKVSPINLYRVIESGVNQALADWGRRE
jgi:hypothetical protein